MAQFTVLRAKGKKMQICFKNVFRKLLVPTKILMEKNPQSQIHKNDQEKKMD